PARPARPPRGDRRVGRLPSERRRQLLLRVGGVLRRWHRSSIPSGRLAFQLGDLHIGLGGRGDPRIVGSHRGARPERLATRRFSSGFATLPPSALRRASATIGLALPTRSNHSILPATSTPTTGPWQIFWQPTGTTFTSVLALRKPTRHFESLHFLQTSTEALTTYLYPGGARFMAAGHPRPVGSRARDWCHRPGTVAPLAPPCRPTTG